MGFAASSLPSSSSMRRDWPWLLLAAVVVTFRSAVFVWHGTLAFDSDQAVIGLMVKHIAEGRAFPLFQYALPYVLVVSAWLTTPFFWVMGATIAALKTPLLLLNILVGVWLVRAASHAGLRPAVAFVVALPFLAVAPITASGLMDALGMTIEPLALVAALWMTRRSPILFGLVAGVGFLVREFIAYGVAAVWLVDVLEGRWRARERTQHWAIVLVVFLGTKAAIGALNRFASPAGPGTWLAADGGDNVATLSGAFCFAPSQAIGNLLIVGKWYLGVLLGAVPERVSDAAMQSAVRQGAAGAWLLLGLTMAAMTLTVLWRVKTVWRSRTTPLVQLGLFLAAVGAQAVLIYAISRCAPISVVTLRYALLGVFLPSGLALLWLSVESRRWVRGAVLGVFVLSAAVNLGAHAALWREQVRSPRVANRQQLAEALEQQGVRYARADYWTAYYVSFLTQERVIVGPTTFSRIDEYERLLSSQPGPVPTIVNAPCVPTAPGASGQSADARTVETPISPGFYLCP